MALSSVTLSVDVNQLLGDDLIPGTTRAYVTTNVANKTLMDTSTGEIRLGDQLVTLDAAGEGFITTWVPGADGNPVSWQTSLVVQYRRQGARQRETRTFGPWTLSAANDGDSIAALEEEQAVPAEYLTQVTDELQTYSDAAEVSATSAAASAASAAASATTAVNARNQATEIALGDAEAAFDGFLAARDLPADGADLSASYGGRFLVTAFGAVGDGAVDDTTAIQAAINAAGADGGWVFFPPGTYLISDTLVLPSDVTLQGVGRAATVRLASGSDCDMLKTTDFDTLTGTGSTAGVVGFNIYNLVFDGNDAGNASGRGLSIYGTGFCIADVEIFSCAGDGIYSEWNVNQLPATGFLEASLRGVRVHDNGGDGVVWAGPHDSVWHDVIAYRNNPTGKNFWVKLNGNALKATACHAWGTAAYAWYLEANAQLIQCEGEGATAAQVFLGNNDIHIIGGHYFLGNGASARGLMFGDATHLLVAAAYIVTKVSTCAVLVDFAQAGGNSFVQVQGYQTSGVARSGSIPSTDHVEIIANGDSVRTLFQHPGPTTVKANSTSAFTVSDGSSNTFNVNATSKVVELLNGGDLVAYSGNFTGETWRLDAATGIVTTNSTTHKVGAGAPTHVANVGSTYCRNDGGAGSTFYVKESGSGTSAGWVAK